MEPTPVEEASLKVSMHIVVLNPLLNYLNYVVGGATAKSKSRKKVDHLLQKNFSDP